ncbi:phage Mu F like family protein [Pseudomonas mediterranea]|uniref:Phage head morphogenesis domain-containing protein n=1 Tax=Pseudomonas mediterranea TaxID=183795 RepID=A0AAX2DED0_9PSED|nr:phage Mu F like family protein [Pseudomonas mediterranea]KGU87211.1 phage Mu F like family protein [Pseudomonas mediterranea CFBP 5447]SDU61667.1 hypothetical protein SAMN05216476_3672 [Pseudomonas mediterranea]
MATVNETLRDEGLAHAVDLDKYKLGVVRRIIALLNRSDASLTAALAEALERMPAESFTVERLEGLLDEVRAVNEAAYAQVMELLETELKGFAGYEMDWQQDLFKATVPEPVLVRFPIVSIGAEQIYAAAMARPFQGRLLRNWGKEIAAGRMAKIRNAVRIGYLEGKTTDQIVRSIRGSRANNYADGFLERPRQDLASIVRTAVSHTAAVARENFNAANSDLIASEDWTSTLDTKTSKDCRIRDKLPYEVGTHRPIGHKVPWLEGPGRIHFNCRSTSTPRTRSWRELGIPVDEMTQQQRASMDGQVPADTTYAEWLGRQSAERQEQVLGPVRAKMMRDGMKLEEFYSPNGTFLTLEQLRERDAATFAKMAA